MIPSSKTEIVANEEFSDNSGCQNNTINNLKGVLISRIVPNLPFSKDFRDLSNFIEKTINEFDFEEYFEQSKKTLINK